MGRVTVFDTNGAGMYRGVEDGVGMDSMFAVGKAPWHYAYNEDMIRLVEEGHKVKAADVNRVAGLDWNVYQTPAYMQMPDESFNLVGTVREKGKAPTPDYWLNVRDDTHRVVGVVQKRYTVFQNTEAPIFLDSLVDSGEALYETAGSLHGGSTVWWLMKLPEGVTVAGDAREKIETYILLTNSHDGSSAVVVAIVPIRVVCQNTLAWAIKGALRSTKVRHTPGAPVKFTEARRALEIGFSYTEALTEIADQMMHTSFSDTEFRSFLDSLVPTPEAKTENGKVLNQRGITQAINVKDTITSIYDVAPNQIHIKGTVWGAVQAVQAYSDHHAIYRNTETASAQENRFKRALTGKSLGADAFAKAQELVKV